MITSLQNPRIKSAIKLRDARQRQKQGRIIIDGAREIMRALQGRVELTEFFVCDELCTSNDCRLLVKALAEPVAHGSRSLDVPTDIIRVNSAVFAKLAYGARAEGIVGVAKTPAKSLADLVLPANPLVAVLEGVEKPGNVGAVLRSADAAGVTALIVCDAGTDLFNPNTIRASLGTIFTVPVCAASAAQALVWLRRQKLSAFVASVDAQTEYTAADFTGPCAIVLGSEATGLSRQWIEESGAPPRCNHAITPIKLPMLGVADSLNVSNAAAVLFYEALRQRRGHRRAADC